MSGRDIYKDIAKRTQGDIYIGVVGPVRTGKSTFIKQFMDLMVLPNIQGYSKERARDELPQSAEGKTIMTTEPKFVPNESVEVKLEDGAAFKVRLIDCVGYLVEGANGHLEEEEPRMVSTPWSKEKIPFTMAAEIGTQKVINDHSTIGIVVTTDGSIVDIPRNNYIPAEERVVKELKAINKPFVIILNTKIPYSEQTEKTTTELKNKYSVPVIPVDIAQLKEENIENIMETILYEFPISQINIKLPKWVEALADNHWLKEDLLSTVKALAEKTGVLKEIKQSIDIFKSNPHIKKSYIEKIDPGKGEISMEISLKDNLFYDVLSNETDTQINNEYELFSIIKELSVAKKEYDKIKFALDQVNTKGYGVVIPDLTQINMEKPQVIKGGSGYGIKINATAPAIHLIKTDIQAAIAPVVGGQEQSEELAKYLQTQYEEDMLKAMEYSVFGKSLGTLMNQELCSKLSHLPEDTQNKLKITMEKIINEGNGGMICILL